MIRSILSAISLLITISAFGQIAGKIIEGKNYKGVIFSADKKLDPKDTVNRWTPSVSDIEKLEAELQKFMLQQNKKTMINQGNRNPIISKNLNKYIRQYAGYISPKGEKMIFVNCFWYEKDDPFSKNWENKLIQVLDGGSYFWQIHYDMLKQKFTGFAVNGDA